MSYQPLARKYRPAKFSDLVGQDSVAKALAGAINLDRLHPSIIFSGVRGIGKTTTARLLAKALCCDKGVSAEPCGVCESCKAVGLGTHEDVLEIDGASNNGVDEVRSLRESVGYIPQRSKYKVYIIDEVHMLSVSAFNALLKTLEEPPPNVIFIFATTELHKVPATVIGRCLTFHLKKFTNADIVKRVKHILAEEQIKYEDQALAVVAREGHGSMRDALTFLDQVIAIGDGKVTMESMKGIVSSISSDPYLDLLSAMVDKNAQLCIDLLESLDEAGVVFGDVAKGLAEFSRHAFILKGLGQESLEKSLLGLTDDEILKIATIADRAEDLEFNRIFRVVQNCLRELDGSDLDRFTLENCLLEWCFDPGFPKIDELLHGGFAQQSMAGVQGVPQGKPSAALRHKPKQSLVKSLMAELKKDDGTVPEQVAEEKKIGQAEPETTNKPVVKISREGLKKRMEQAKAPDTPPASVVKQEPMNSSTEGGGGVPQNLEPTPQQQASPKPLEAQEAFPADWRGLVDAWKRLKPIQARKLEEVHPLKYSQHEILVATDTTGMIGQELMKANVQQYLTQTFRELFGFQGTFKVVSKKNMAPEFPQEIVGAIPQVPEAKNTLDLASAPEGVNVESSQRTPESGQFLPESIEQQKTKESQVRRKEILEAAKGHDLIQSLVREFNGEIVDIKVKDPKAFYGLPEDLA